MISDVALGVCSVSEAWMDSPVVGDDEDGGSEQIECNTDAGLRDRLRTEMQAIKNALQRV